jgi:hypothetical protein
VYLDLVPNRAAEYCGPRAMLRAVVRLNDEERARD